MQELQHIFNKQKEFQILLFKDKFNLNFDELTEEQKLEWTKEFVLCLNEESFEVLRELNWKTHVHSKKEINRENILEESVDVFKYLLNIILVNGFTADEFLESFNKKTDKVLKKYQDKQ